MKPAPEWAVIEQRIGEDVEGDDDEIHTHEAPTREAAFELAESLLDDCDHVEIVQRVGIISLGHGIWDWSDERLIASALNHDELEDALASSEPKGGR